MQQQRWNQSSYRGLAKVSESLEARKGGRKGSAVQQGHHEVRQVDYNGREAMVDGGGDGRRTHHFSKIRLQARVSSVSNRWEK